MSRVLPQTFLEVSLSFCPIYGELLLSRGALPVGGLFTRGPILLRQRPALKQQEEVFPAWATLFTTWPLTEGEQERGGVNWRTSSG